MGYFGAVRASFSNLRRNLGYSWIPGNFGLLRLLKYKVHIHSLRNWIMIWSPKQLQSCLKSDNWFGLLFRKFHEFFERFKSLLVIYKFIFNYYTNRLWSGHLNIRKSQWCKLKSSKSCFKVASVVLDPEFLTAFFEIR